MIERILVNGRFSGQPMTGAQRYAREVTQRLGFRAHLLTPKHSFRGWQGHSWEQLALPGLIPRGEMLWSPVNSGPLAVANQVVTIHDVGPLDHPEWFRTAYSTWYRFLLPALARRVKGVITVSEFSKRRILERLAAPDQKVFVVPNGVGENFSPQPEFELQRVQKKYRLSSTYLLTVGTLEPRKNLERLFQVWQRLQCRPQEAELVVVGSKGAVFRDPGMHLVPSGVRVMDYIEEADLAALYSGAKFMVYISLYEGFGLPVLEAMACGTPVIASNTTALPEVVGEAGWLVNPDDTDEITFAIDRMIQDQALGEQMRRCGLKRAKLFSWETTTQRTWDVFRQLAGD